jgi:Tfp pilus assembly protein PilV
MKKILFTLIPALALVFLIASCSKDDTNNNTSNATAQGTWTGTGQYGTSGGNPTYVFTLNFKADGTVDITGDNTVGVDVATGTWQMVADSVKATYKYASSSAIYVLSGKYSASSNVMVGTIGLSPVSSGVGIFTVTRTN